MQDWDRLVETWQATLRAVERVRGYTTRKGARSAGISHSKMWGLTIEGPASPADIERIEADIRSALPPALRAFYLKCASKVDFRWQLPDEFRVSRFSGLFGGGFSLSLNAMPEHATSMREWVEGCFHNPDDPYDAVWHQKLGVIPVMNGDYIGIDLRPEHYGEV